MQFQISEVHGCGHLNNTSFIVYQILSQRAQRLEYNRVPAYGWRLQKPTH